MQSASQPEAISGALKASSPRVSSFLIKMVTVFSIGGLLFLLRPQEISVNGWILFTTFVSTILAIILKAMPMGALSILAISILVATKAISLGIILQGFSHDLIWLIVMSCFLARGFIKTGLGRRIAYLFISFFGGSPLGLSYGFLLSATTMAPLIPSATARTGGIILPVLQSIIQVINGEKKAARFAEYLTLVVMNSSVLTSAMFITSNGGNPMCVKFAKNLGISINWATWALASSIPAIVCLILLPLLLKLFIPCGAVEPQKIKDHAKEELTKLGPISSKEKITLGVFVLLLFFWSCGAFFGVHPTEAAILGVGLFLIANVISWKDILSEELAWDTFFWMAILIMMATEMQTMGVIDFLTQQITGYIPCYNWQIAFLVVSLIYFYTHYFFASTTAHMSSMFTPLVCVLISLGAPPLVTALAFGFMTNLCGGLTQYSSGPAPILFSQGQVEFRSWLKAGFITSVFYLVVWLGLGFVWWKFLNLY
jgi:DASS family divalent anion:Na+ symporter